MWVTLLRYKPACILSREALLALSLIEQAMQSRTRDESTHGCRWQGAVGAMKHWWVHGGKALMSQLHSGVILFVLSMKQCGATWHQIVLRQEQMHWAVRGRAMTRRRGAGDTPAHLLGWETPPSLMGCLVPWEHSSPYYNFPKSRVPNISGTSEGTNFSTGLVEMESSMSCRHWPSASHIALRYTAPMSTSLKAKYSLLYGVSRSRGNSHLSAR